MKPIDIVSRVVPLAPAATLLSHEGDIACRGPADPLDLGEDGVPPGSRPCAPESGVVQDHRPSPAATSLLDDAISHIYQAGVLIQARRDGGGAAQTPELDGATDQLTAAIRLLQVAALDIPDTRVLTTEPTHWAWSGREDRWVGMTFCELQVWVAHCGLDPVEFASHEVPS
jgi:hypothetical protein